MGSIMSAIDDDFKEDEWNRLRRKPPREPGVDYTIGSAGTGDIYINPEGQVWKIIGIVREPTVIAVRMGETGSEGILAEHRQVGGISDAMWDGFTRVWTHD